MNENHRTRQETYREKLKDPRWRKKRLEIFRRDNFTCRYCGDWQTTLHVHHLRYHRDCEPWEYQQNDLLTVCEDCHSFETAERRKVEQDLIEVLRTKGFSADDLVQMVITLETSVFCCEKSEFVEFFDWMMTSAAQEEFVRSYYDSGIPSEWVRANPGLDGRPIPDESHIE